MAIWDSAAQAKVCSRRIEEQGFFECVEEILGMIAAQMPSDCAGLDEIIRVDLTALQWTVVEGAMMHMIGVIDLKEGRKGKKRK